MGVIRMGDKKPIYTHEEMVKLCDEAKKDQRNACAEALSQCDKDVSGECIWVDEAREAVMNAII